jgi:hypothetical protein
VGEVGEERTGRGGSEAVSSEFLKTPPCFIIGGPPAAGKTTISGLLMARFEKGFHIPVDDLREWVVSGLADPDDWTEETSRQFRLAEESAADLARRYREAGFAVAFDHCRRTEELDWITDERLGGPPVYRILLFSSLETNLQRNCERTNKDFNTADLIPTIEGLNGMLSPSFGARNGWTFFDNEPDGPEEAVDRLLKLLGIQHCQGH